MESFYINSNISSSIHSYLPVCPLFSFNPHKMLHLLYKSPYFKCNNIWKMWGLMEEKRKWWVMDDQYLFHKRLKEILCKEINGLLGSQVVKIEKQIVCENTFWFCSLCIHSSFYIDFDLWCFEIFAQSFQFPSHLFIIILYKTFQKLVE